MLAGICFHLGLHLIRFCRRFPSHLPVRSLQIDFNNNNRNAPTHLGTHCALIQKASIAFISVSTTTPERRKWGCRLFPTLQVRQPRLRWAHIKNSSPRPIPLSPAQSLAPLSTKMPKPEMGVTSPCFTSSFLSQPDSPQALPRSPKSLPRPLSSSAVLAM